MERLDIIEQECLSTSSEDIQCLFDVAETLGSMLEHLPLAAEKASEAHRLASEIFLLAELLGESDGDILVCSQYEMELFFIARRSHDLLSYNRAIEDDEKWVNSITATMKRTKKQLDESGS